MPETPMLTDAALDEIEARANERRWSDTLMSDQMKSVIVNDVPTLIAALRASRERERRYEALVVAAREWCRYMADADSNEDGSFEDEERMMAALNVALESCPARAALGEQEAQG